jgi:hypothetical protein
MSKYLFAPQVLERLADRAFFRIFSARILKAAAAIVALYAIIVFFLGWKELFELSSEAMIGGIIYQLLFAFASYLVVHAILLRARDVRALDESLPPAVAVSAIVARLAGETYAFASSLLGIGGAVFVWFAGRGAGRLLEKADFALPFLKAAPASFEAGAALVIKGVLGGALALLLGFLLAELLVARADRLSDMAASDSSGPHD